MTDSNNRSRNKTSVRVWDKNVRIFHWLNFICILGLIALGLFILYAKEFGVNSDGKILLKTLHTYVGYVFVVNLAIRLIWAFFGSGFSKWKAILPFKKGYISSLKNYISGFKKRDAPVYAGHNPVARLMVTLLFLSLTTQAVTGLVLTGTDLYMPPFGNQIEEWVRTPVENSREVQALTPGSKEGVDPDAYQAMRSFRMPFITVHKYGFYVLGFLILFHIGGVVVTEVRERNGLVSAMFTGEKVFTKPPVDIDDT